MLTSLYISQYFPNECLYVNVTFYEIDTCQLVTRIIAFELVIEIGHPLHKVLISWTSSFYYHHLRSRLLYRGNI